jgi:hypothetical protein
MGMLLRALHGEEGAFQQLQRVFGELDVPSNAVEEATASYVLLLCEAHSTMVTPENLKAALSTIMADMPSAPLTEEGKPLLHRAATLERLVRTCKTQSDEFEAAQGKRDFLAVAGRLVETYNRLRRGNKAVADILHSNAIVEARRLRSAHHRQIKP